MRHLVAILAVLAILAQGLLAPPAAAFACGASNADLTQGDGCCPSTSAVETTGESEAGCPPCVCCNVAPSGVAMASTLLSVVDSPARGAIAARVETSHLNVLALPAVPPPRV